MMPFLGCCNPRTEIVEGKWEQNIAGSIQSQLSPSFSKTECQSKVMPIPIDRDMVERQRVKQRNNDIRTDYSLASLDAPNQYN